MKLKKEGLNVNYLITYTLLLLFFLLLSNIVVEYTFNFLGKSIIFSVFTYPFVFFFMNKIINKEDKFKSMSMLFIVLLSQIMIYYYLDLLGIQNISSTTLIASLTSFSLSMLTYIYMFDSIKKNKVDNFLNLFLTYALALLVDNLVFYAMSGIAIDIVFVYAMIIRLIIAFILTVVDYKIFNK